MRCPVCRTALAIDPEALEAPARGDGGGSALPPHFPFCSERCRLVDLGRWATGRYAIPGDPVDPESLPPAAAAPDDA